MNTTRWWREPTRGQWLSFGAAWSGWVLDAFDFTIFMLVMPQLAREFGASAIATTGSIALTLVARLVGGFFAGAAADRWGRKLPLLVSIVWFALCDGSVAFAPSFGWILVLRTLFGFGMGAEWTSGTTLAMENWPARSRGIASGILQGSWAIGYLAAALVSAIVLPLWGWRALFVIAALPALLVLPMRAWIPESPCFREPRARERVAWPIAKLAWASSAMAVGFGAYYALTALYPTMLSTELAMSERAVAWLVALFNVGMLAGSVATGVLAARRGAYAAIAIPALASIAALPLYVGAVPGLLGLGALATGALGAGFCGVVPMLLTDLVEARVRARFVGLAYHFGAFFAAYVPMAIAGFAKGARVSIGSSIALVAGACELALVVLVVAQMAKLRRSGPRHAAAVALSALLFAGCSADAPPREDVGTTAARLEAVTSFGSNPGNLLMYRYVPASMPANAPLVVVLHGCTQAAADFANAGWDALADQHKFYVAYPQQQSANNPVECFDWWGQYNNPANKTNITRGGGENESIKQMVDKMKADFSIDGARVFVAGFSSGGAMAAVMMAAWPDVFAAGGIASGVAYDCPSTTNQDVWSCMSPGKTLTPDDWGARVENAYPGWSGPWPRASIWQGTQDTTVAVANETELVKQWTDVHGLSQTPTSSDTVGGFPHDVYADGNGHVQVERYAITGMAHGFAVDPAHGCGTAGNYLYDEKLCQAALMLRFFGIADEPMDGGAGDASVADGGIADASSADAAALHDGSAPADAASNPYDAGHRSDSGSPPGTHDGGSSPAPAPAGSASESSAGSSFAGCSAAPRPSRGVPPLAFAAIALAIAAGRRRARRVS